MTLGYLYCYIAVAASDRVGMKYWRSRYVVIPWHSSCYCETLHKQMKKARRLKGRFAKPPVYGLLRQRGYHHELYAWHYTMANTLDHSLDHSHRFGSVRGFWP